MPRGIATLQMAKNSVTGELQALVVDGATGFLKTDATVATSLGDIMTLPDDLYKNYDDAAGSGATRTETVQADFNAKAGVTTSVVRSAQITLKDSASVAGTEIGSVAFKTTTEVAFGDEIPLFNEKAETFDNFEPTEVRLTLTAEATTRSLIYATGRKLT